MELTISIIAITISILSLVFSVLVNTRSIRTRQFQKLSEFRLRLDETLWSLKYRLSDIENCYKSIPEEKTDIKNDYKALIDRQKAFISKLEKSENKIEELYKTFEKLPITIKEGALEDLLYRIKSMKISVDVSRDEILPLLKQSEEKFKKVEELMNKVTVES